MLRYTAIALTSALHKSLGEIITVSCIQVSTICSSWQFPICNNLAIPFSENFHTIHPLARWHRTKRRTRKLGQRNRALAPRNQTIPLCALAIAASLAPPILAAEPTTIGWIENIRIAGLDFPIKTKIDTGAKTSSLGITRFDQIKKDGKDWARFSVEGPLLKATTLERPILRWTQIRRAATPVKRRPVVLLSACLGGYYKEAQFTLEKRAGMSYPVLIGRRFLDDKFVVASNKTYLSNPQCTGKAAPYSPKGEK